jgi:hypothetical protein
METIVIYEVIFSRVDYDSCSPSTYTYSTYGRFFDRKIAENYMKELFHDDKELEDDYSYQHDYYIQEVSVFPTILAMEEAEAAED